MEMYNCCNASRATKKCKKITCWSVPTSPDVFVSFQYCTTESGLTSIHVCLFTMFCVFISSVASFHQRMTKPCTTIHICICIPTCSLKLVLAIRQIIISMGRTSKHCIVSSWSLALPTMSINVKWNPFCYPILFKWQLWALTYILCIQWKT